jgi:DNA polymerase-3 subunit alpha
MHLETFLDVLSAIKQNKICDSRELEILISINFFEQFGNPNQLLNEVEIYNKYANAKIIKKDGLTQKELQTIHKYAQKETEKQFRDIDNIGLVNALIAQIKDKTSVIEQISYDLKYLGYSTLKCDTSLYGVEAFELNQYGTPYVKLYRISTGESMTFKIDRKWYNQFSKEYGGKLEQGDIIDVTIDERPKRRKDENGEWVEIGTELVVTAFCRK